MLWPGSPNHMISVMWICWSSEASGLRREVRPRHQPNFCWKISFSGWLWVTLRSLPYAYAPHTMIQYLADFAMVWILNANSWLAPVVGMELANRCWYCLSASVSVPQGQGPMFPVAQPLSFSWEIAFVLWGGGKAGVAASIPGTPCPRAERFTGPFAAIGMEQFVSSLLRAGALFTVALTGCCKQMGNGE